MAYYALSDSRIYAITRAKFTSGGSFPIGLFVSENEGRNWVRKDYSGVYAQSVLSAKDDSWLCIGHFRGISCTTDDGTSWNPWNEGLTNSRVPSVFVTQEGEVFAGAIQGAYLKDKTSDQWGRLDIDEREFPVHDFHEAEWGMLTAVTSWFHRSFDKGRTWERVPTEFIAADKYSGTHSIKSTDVYASDVPAIAIPYVIPCPHEEVFETPFISLGDTLAYLTQREFRISDDEWETVYRYDSISSFGDRSGLRAMIKTPGGSILVGGMEAVLLRSEDRGVTWSRSVMDDNADLMIQEFALTPGNRMIAATNVGAYFSDDDGVSWTRYSGQPGQECLNAIAISQKGVILLDGKVTI